MRLDAEQDVSQVRLGVDAVGLAGGHQGVEAREVLTRRLVADKEEILPAQGGLSQQQRRPEALPGLTYVGLPNP